MILPLSSISFLRFSLIDVIDIAVVAVLIFILFYEIRKSSAANILIAILSIYLIKVIVDILEMRMTAAILSGVLDVGVISLIIIFQPEIRRFLSHLGARYQDASKRNTMLARLFDTNKDDLESNAMTELIDACREMSEEKTGALIVIPGRVALDDIIETGDRIDAVVNSRLIRNIFFKNSPLHDGAMVLSGEKIVAARCTLPITQKTDLPASYGMRHKSAIGITEATDAQVVLVSEESGHVAYSRGGEMVIVNNLNELRLLLLQGNDSSSAAKAENK